MWLSFFQNAPGVSSSPLPREPMRLEACARPVGPRVNSGAAVAACDCISISIRPGAADARHLDDVKKVRRWDADFTHPAEEKRHRERPQQ